jgi:hypothetical protein
MRLPALSTWLVTAVLLLSGHDLCGQTTADDAEKGKVVTKSTRYVQYLPRQEAKGVLVIVHGMPTAEDARNIVSLAEKFLKRWTTFAEEHRLISLVPALDDENFDSVKGDHGAGYRSLFGRYIGADQFVN